MIKIIKTQKELKIVLTNKQEFIDEFGFDNPNPSIGDLLEASKYLGNGYFDCTDLIGLTSSPIIGYDVSFNDDNIINGDFYYFPNYMLENPFETLLEKGNVIFIHEQLFFKQICLKIFYSKLKYLHLYQIKKRYGTRRNIKSIRW